MPKLILVANTDWYLYNFRLHLSQRARDEGYDVVLVSPMGEFVNDLRKAGFRWVEWEVGRQTTSPLSELRSLQRLYKIYKKERPDIVHHFTIKPVIYGSFCANWIKVPAIVNSITGLGYVFVQQGVKALLGRMVARLGYKNLLSRPGTAVIFENSSDQAYFLDNKIVHEGNSHLIEGVGVDPEQYCPVPEPAGNPLVVQASRLLWDKGVGVVVEASKILKAKHQGVRIALVGEPDPGNPASIEKRHLKQWTRDGLVEWWGFQYDMPAVYQQSHIVVLPSVREGLPTALIEAASCGKPLVATDVPGCRDVVTDGVNGFLVPVNNSVKLAEAIHKLLVDPDLRNKFGEASRRVVLERFTDAHILVKTMDVYKNLLEKTL